MGCVSGRDAMAREQDVVLEAKGEGLRRAPQNVVFVNIIRGHPCSTPLCRILRRHACLVGKFGCIAKGWEWDVGNRKTIKCLKHLLGPSRCVCASGELALAKQGPGAWM